MLFSVSYISVIYRMDVNVIYCSPDSSNLMSCSVWMICSVAGVVCHGGFGDFGLGVLNGITLSSSLAALSTPLLWSEVASVQVTMAGAGMSTIARWWFESVSSFLIFLAVSRAWSCVAISMCLVMWCQCSRRGYFMRAVHDNMSTVITFMTYDMMAVSCISAICSGSWHWKHLSSLLDIMSTAEDGMIVVVSCCAALNFSTSVISSFNICGLFSYIVAAKLCAFL